MAETAALQHRLQHAFPDSLRQRLRELTRTSEAEALTTDERTEYIVLAAQREEADAERFTLCSGSPSYVASLLRSR